MIERGRGWRRGKGDGGTEEGGGVYESNVLMEWEGGWGGVYLRAHTSENLNMS